MKCHDKGFTLIELLVSLVIGLLVLLGTFKIFQGSLESYSYINNASANQTDMVFIANILMRTIRESGVSDANYELVVDPEDENSCALKDPEGAIVIRGLYKEEDESCGNFSDGCDANNEESEKEKIEGCNFYKLKFKRTDSNAEIAYYEIGFHVMDRSSIF